MATKQDFTEQEWASLERSISGTGLLVSLADRDFTDTFGAFRQRENDPRREMTVMGVYRWKDGKLTKVVDDMPAVNGLAFSPDEKYLYINGSRDNYVNRYEVRADGQLLTCEPARVLPMAQRYYLF